MFQRFFRLFAVLSGLVAGAAHAADQPYQAGFLQFRTAGPSGVPVSVWYPTQSPEASIRIGSTDLQVARDAVPVPGRHRLILISHGSEGSDLGHTPLAEQLARRGFVVAAPRHLGDSYDDKTALGTDRQFGARPLQASATLDAVLALPVLSGSIDGQRIGMLGYSAGGFTSLVMAGAKPDRQNWIRYCMGDGPHGVACPIGWWTSLWLRILYKDWDRPAENRIKAVALLAPFGAMFDRAALTGVTVPVLLFGARDDEMLPPAGNAERIRDALPVPPDYQVTPGAHFIYVPPCSADLLAAAPKICLDGPGIDRPAIHRMVNARIAEFFETKL